MSKIIVANWKMNPASSPEALKLAKESDIEGLVICPPFVFIKEVASVIHRSHLGAQDLFWNKGVGSYTGEISAKELKSVGARYVIVGHSERRYPPLGHGESNKEIAKKLQAAVQVGLVPILCVGETLKEKENGQREKALREEIVSAFRNLAGFSNIYVAYEPIWAISSSNSSAKEIKADYSRNSIKVISFLKTVIANVNKDVAKHVHFLYGGSVNSCNAKSFLQHKEIDGLLVGRASLNPEEIKKIKKLD